MPKRIYERETFRNKIWSLTLICMGIASTYIDGDATACLVLIGLGICLFFAKEDIFKD